MTTGATAFWIAMMQARDLSKADPAKLASKYEIPETWARYWLTVWQGRDR